MIYLDNAATTLQKPPQVAQAVLTALGTLGNAGRGGHVAALQAARTVYATREALCTLFHASAPEQIAFTLNATQALNNAIAGLIAPGDGVVTTVQEHNSVLRPLYRARAALTIVPLGVNERVQTRDVLAAIHPGVRAVVIAHASNVTGDALSLAPIGAACRECGALLIVDAAQTAGVIPIDMRRDGIDVLCFTGHKALYGPQGTGGICVRAGLSIAPLYVGGSGARTFEHAHPAQMPTALEAGTLNAHGIAGLEAGVRFVCETGTEKIGREQAALARAFCQGICDAPGVRIRGDWRGENRTGIAAFQLKGVDSACVADALDERFGILTRAGAHCAPLMHMALGTQAQGIVRVSFSYHNTLEQAHAAAQAVRMLAEEADAYD